MKIIEVNSCAECPYYKVFLYTEKCTKYNKENKKYPEIPKWCCLKKDEIMDKKDLTKFDINLIKSLIVAEMRKLESALNFSRNQIGKTKDEEYLAKHINKLNTKINELDTLLKKLS